MKLLICIPAIFNGVVLKEALDSIIDKPVDIIVLDNGSIDSNIRTVLDDYGWKDNITIWTNSVNEYVNKPWTEFISNFLHHDEYTHLALMNSDLTLQRDWYEVLEKRLTENPEEVTIPFVTDDKEKLKVPVNTNLVTTEPVYEGIPGIFILLNKRLAKAVYPLPYNKCKVWFGDTYIYRIAKELGFITAAPENFIGFHHISTSVQGVPGIHAIIEQDKKAWYEYQAEFKQLIEKLK